MNSSRILPLISYVSRGHGNDSAVSLAREQSLQKETGWIRGLRELFDNVQRIRYVFTASEDRWLEIVRLTEQYQGGEEKMGAYRKFRLQWKRGWAAGGR